jgi:Phage integrase family
MKRFTGPEPTAWVFVGVKGSALRRTNSTRIWKAARLEARRADLHAHDLRLLANTLAASAGASTRELMARLGHSSPATALRYQHATAERDRAIADRMTDMIEGTAPSRVPCGSSRQADGLCHSGPLTTFDLAESGARMVSELEFPARAGDGNRTRVISLEG